MQLNASSSQNSLVLTVKQGEFMLSMQCYTVSIFPYCTVNLEIFGVNIFSDTAKNRKIKITKIPCLEIIGVYNFGQMLASENFFTQKFLTRKFLDTKIFGFMV